MQGHEADFFNYFFFFFFFFIFYVIIVCRVYSLESPQVSDSNEYIQHTIDKPASVAQLDAPSDWRPGGRGFNPCRGRQHSFVEIDHEIFSRVILSR